MTDRDIVAAICRQHLKANIAEWEADTTCIVHWDRATVDHSGVFAVGPYLHVPVTWDDDYCVVRVYPPARLARRLAAHVAKAKAIQVKPYKGVMKWHTV
jgi:hypothetical protein